MPNWRFSARDSPSSAALRSICSCKHRGLDKGAFLYGSNLLVFDIALFLAGFISCNPSINFTSTCK